MATLPTLYEYYTAGGIDSGLSVNQDYFTLNNKNMTIYSGALHYFRIPKPYWRDRLRKLRAAGLNTVETVVPWNLHEPEINNFDFGYNGSDMENFLDLPAFLKMAQEEDLFAIVRPGPYICAEWEFGGLPSWLLRDKEMKVRTSNTNFMNHVTRYFNVLLPILAALQFTLGGPIIALQVENEYAVTRQWPSFEPDKVYLEQLRQLHINNGIVELLVTSDNPLTYGDSGTLPEYFLQTANFDENPEDQFNRMKELQFNKPSMAMEYWSCWFDDWTSTHNTCSGEKFYDILDRILRYPASLNIYMFHGGTNWGFLNGAKVYLPLGNSNFGFTPTTTSYDYDAPLTEAGDYTEKYYIIKKLISEYNTVEVTNPQEPDIIKKIAYPKIGINQQLRFEEIMAQIPDKFSYTSTVAMELLPINNNSGQSYGYIIYKKNGLDIPGNSELKITGFVYDTVMVLIDGILISDPLTSKQDLNGFGYWRIINGKLNLGAQPKVNATLELIVENWGRNNVGSISQFRQFKGLWSNDIFLNSEQLLNWEVSPLQFKKQWTNNLSLWHTFYNDSEVGPALYKSSLVVDNPQDTFIDMRKWTKGIVIINGFVLGRYASPLGPQQTLYLPAPLLNNGTNEIIIFEHFAGDREIIFSEKPIYYTPSNKNIPS